MHATDVVRTRGRLVAGHGGDSTCTWAPGVWTFHTGCVMKHDIKLTNSIAKLQASVTESTRSPDWIATNQVDNFCLAASKGKTF